MNAVFRLLKRSLLFFAGISIWVLCLSWLELLVPARMLWSAAVYGQLRSLSELLPFHVILLPLLTGLAGAAPDQNPRLRALGLAAVVLGGFGFLAAFLAGGLEAGWAFAVAHPLTRGQVSVWQILAILSACFGTALLSLLRAGNGATPLLRRTAVLTVPGVALIASAAFFALKQRLTGMEMVDTGVWLTGPVWPVAAGLSLLHSALLLSLFGLLERELPVSAAKPELRPAVNAVLIAAFLAPELRMLPMDLPAFALLGGTFGHSLLLCAWGYLCFRRFRGVSSFPLSTRTLAVLSLGGLAIVLGYWLNLVTASAVYSQSHLETARRFALAAAALFAMLPAPVTRAQILRVQVLALSCLGVLPPLLWLGGTAIPAGLALYPVHLLHAHVLVFVAGLLGLGACGLLSLAAFSQKIQKSV